MTAVDIGRRWHPMRRRVDSGLWEIFLPGITGIKTDQFTTMLLALVLFTIGGFYLKANLPQFGELVQMPLP